MTATREPALGIRRSLDRNVERTGPGGTRWVGLVGQRASFVAEIAVFTSAGTSRTMVTIYPAGRIT